MTKNQIAQMTRSERLAAARERLLAAVGMIDQLSPDGAPALDDLEIACSDAADAAALLDAVFAEVCS